MARGSVFRKAGGWAFRVDTGFQPGTGKRRQMLRQGFPTKKAAVVALADVAAGSSKGAAVSKSTIRVEDFLSDWLVTARSKLRPTTHYSYEVAVGRVSRELGRHQLQSLTPMQIENFYARQLTSGGRGAARWTRRRSATHTSCSAKHCQTPSDSVSYPATRPPPRVPRFQPGPIWSLGHRRSCAGSLAQ